MVLAVGILMFISREFDFFQNSQLYAETSSIAVFLAVPVAVSVFLARNFARTNRHRRYFRTNLALAQTDESARAFMAMTMLKINGSRAVVGMAGMPSVLIYHAQTKQIEDVAIRAMPLGGFSKSAYVQQELTLSAGDTVVLMSDGFPEMFNEAGEMLADETAKNVLAEVAHELPQEIINRFVEVGETWAGTRPPVDDVTFVVLKVKAANDNDS
jgi:hypothetical protein